MEKRDGADQEYFALIDRANQAQIAHFEVVLPSSLEVRLSVLFFHCQIQKLQKWEQNRIHFIQGQAQSPQLL